MPRFVILEHDHPQLHWDLLLESGTILRAWRLSAPPGVEQTLTATASFDHRLLYLDYEGPISGDRGRVVCWEHGPFVWEVQAVDRIVVRLQGARQCGVLRLERVEADSWRGEFLADTTHS